MRAAASSPGWWSRRHRARPRSPARDAATRGPGPRTGRRPCHGCRRLASVGASCPHPVALAGCADAGGRCGVVGENRRAVRFFGSDAEEFEQAGGGDAVVLALLGVTAEDNIMGEMVKGGYGGGIPVVAFWTRQVGEAVGHVETIPI